MRVASSEKSHTTRYFVKNVWASSSSYWTGASTAAQDSSATSKEESQSYHKLFFSLCVHCRLLGRNCSRSFSHSHKRRGGDSRLWVRMRRAAAAERLTTARKQKIWREAGSGASQTG